MKLFFHMQEDNLGGFYIVCPDCQKANRKHETLLYVDWDGYFYTINCQTCKKASYFDFKGKLISPLDVLKERSMSDKGKYIN